MFFRKEFFSVNFVRKKFVIDTSFRKFSFHEKICFWTFSILNYFFFKRNHFSEFKFFSKKMLQILCVSGENVWKNKII